MIELLGIRRHYRDGERLVHALRQVDLRVGAGETVALTGPSGSGKSTLLHLIGGLDRPQAGQVRVAGVSLETLDDRTLTRFRLTQVGFVFQFFHLVPTCTVRENLHLPAELAGLERGLIRRRASELAAAVGVDGLAHRYPDRLSGGEQQRVAIARALMLEPPLLLADEPTGNLDGANGQRVLELLFRMARERGMTLVMATHGMEAAARAARRVELHDGRITADGPQPPQAREGPAAGESAAPPPGSPS